jgi:hypothetical protein
MQDSEGDTAVETAVVTGRLTTTVVDTHQSLHPTSMMHLWRHFARSNGNDL